VVDHHAWRFDHRQRDPRRLGRQTGPRHRSLVRRREPRLFRQLGPEPPHPARLQERHPQRQIHLVLARPSGPSQQRQPAADPRQAHPARRSCRRPDRARSARAGIRGLDPARPAMGRAFTAGASVLHLDHDPGQHPPGRRQQAAIRQSQRRRQPRLHDADPQDRRRIRAQLHDVPVGLRRRRHDQFPRRERHLHRAARRA
jgi:hypothetical protein